MFDYLAKFNDLPKAIRDKVSGPAVLATIDELEKKYGVSLAPLVMKVMVKDISLGELVVYFAEESQMEASQAEKLSSELKDRIFNNVLEYLNGETNSKAENLDKEKPAVLNVAPMPIAPKVVEKKPDIESTIKIIENKTDVIPALVPAKKPDDRSAFYFSPEDEEEVRELAKKLETFNPVARDQKSLDEKIKSIEGEFNITFSSEELLARFRQIIKTYLLGIRKRIETKLALIKPFESGGLNLDADKADKILETADKNYEMPGLILKKPNLMAVPEDLAGQEKSVTDTLINRDVPYDLNALANKEKIKTEEKAENNLKIIIKQEEMDELNKNTSIPEVVKPPVADIAKMMPVNITTGSYLSQANPRQNISADTSAKIRMDDVRFVPKVMGPIDELRFLDLINYRRLSNDPFKATAKIREKIGFLEEEHFKKKIEAIRAWRQSPLNRLYLDVGRQSIEENRPMEVIIEERKNKKQDFLTGQEIEAIMDLNKSLRF